MVVIDVIRNSNAFRTVFRIDFRLSSLRDAVGIRKIEEAHSLVKNMWRSFASLGSKMTILYLDPQYMSQ